MSRCLPQHSAQTPSVRLQVSDPWKTGRTTVWKFTFKFSDAIDVLTVHIPVLVAISSNPGRNTGYLDRFFVMLLSLLGQIPVKARQLECIIYYRAKCTSLPHISSRYWHPNIFRCNLHHLKGLVGHKMVTIRTTLVVYNKIVTWRFKITV
jgi:hypothetical protein